MKRCNNGVINDAGNGARETMIQRGRKQLRSFVSLRTSQIQGGAMVSGWYYQSQDQTAEQITNLLVYMKTASNYVAVQGTSSVNSQK